MRKKILPIFMLILILALSTSVVWANDDESKAKIKIRHKEITINSGEVIVPKVEGIKNKELRKLINDNIIKEITALKNPSPDSSLAGNFNVISNNQKLLVFRFAGSSFTKGTAHPNKIDKGFHLDLTNGKIYSLEDLFLPDVDINMEVKKICLANFDKYRGQELELTTDWTYKSFIDSWHGDNRSFILYPDYIRVYSIPNYATGPIAGYNIPYSDLANFINTQGALWQANLSNQPKI